MSWVETLPERSPRLKELHGEVKALMEQVHELEWQAKLLRQEAYFKSCQVESQARTEYTRETVDRAKSQF
jgi:hypothetical protein